MITPFEALDISFYSGDLNRNVTFREYMIELLSTVFWQEEGFSGKRPFGNSGWTYDLCEALEGRGIERDDADDFIQEMCWALGGLTRPEDDEDELLYEDEETEADD